MIFNLKLSLTKKFYNFNTVLKYPWKKKSHYSTSTIYSTKQLHIGFFFHFNKIKHSPHSIHMPKILIAQKLFSLHIMMTLIMTVPIFIFFKPQNVPALQTAAKFSHVCMHAPWMELPDSLLQNGSMPPSWLFGIETSRVNEGSHLICLQSERLTSHN